MAFEEVRPYTPGDEVRFIDWNVTARAGDPHVKVFQEERELRLLVLLDDSASQSFAGDAEANAVKSWANERLAKHQRLHAVEVRDDFPRNALGKVLKKELRAPYWE